MPLPSFMERGPVLAIDSEVQSLRNQAVLDRLARLVGYVALGLPLVLIFGATIGGSCFRDSISHFYHAQFLGGIFVGLLFFIGGFMIAYRGDTPRENWGSTVAGLGAIGVALFPTAGSGCDDPGAFETRAFVLAQTGGRDSDGMLIITDIDWMTNNPFVLFELAAHYHLAGAGVLFLFLGWYCLFVLRRIIPSVHGEGETLIQSKRQRNVLYFYCGITIWACVALLALSGWLNVGESWWNAYNTTFWVEMVALWAFALAWSAKGRVFARLNDHV